ncbi:MAG TPA: heat-inducible transcriptional repressor HrcA [Euzebyales bacterium]|nr:heat-inducible transcriptional repressor HrcA [Euzebyales bacterium]
MAAEQLDTRKEAILRAIVRDFILDGQPVGSKRVVEELNLAVSAATVRAEMVELEQAGLIRQPHTSAGRIPTDAGYRYYVDHLTSLELAKPAQPDAVDQTLLRATDVEDLLRRTSSVLSRLTRLTALVTAPRLDRSKLRHIELVSLSPHAILLVFIADTGRVEKRILDMADPVADDDVQRARYVVNDAASGLRLTDVHDAIAGVSLAAPTYLQPLLDRVATTIRAGATAAVPEADRVFVGGAAQLALRATDETVDRLGSVYDMLEEQVVLLSMLREALKQDDLAVRIGSELPVDELSPFSMVASTYGASGEALGSLGLLGPTRMDYGQAMTTVRAVANSLERALAALTGTGTTES